MAYTYTLTRNSNWLITLFLIITFISNGFGQVFKHAELRNDYQKKEYFQLRNRFAQLKKTLPLPEQLFYKAALANAFNQSERSNEAIDRLQKSYDRLLTDSLRKKLLNLKADNWIKLYQYKKAAACYSEILDHYRVVTDSTETADLENSKAIWSAIADVPPQQVLIRQTTVVRWQKDKIGLLQIPVSHGKDTCSLVFDTGANLSVIAASAAQELGMKIYPVKLDLASGATGESVQSSLAVADSLYLGKILIRHAVFLLLPDDMLYFKQVDYRQKGIIGEPIMAQLGEVRIHDNGTFEVPAQPSKRNFQNLALDELMPIANFKVQQDSLPFRFDSGASSSILYQPFFEKYNKDILKKGTVYQLRTGGIGGTISTTTAYTLPEFNMSVAGHAFSLPKINVRTTPIGVATETSYGNIGLDIFGRFRVLTINFKTMYLEVQ